MSRVFANGLRDRISIPGQVIPKTQKTVLDAALLSTQYYKVRIKGKVEQSQKMVLDAALLSTQYCKVRIKGKVEQSQEWSSSLPYTLV